MRRTLARVPWVSNNSYIGCFYHFTKSPMNHLFIVRLWDWEGPNLGGCRPIHFFPVKVHETFKSDPPHPPPPNLFFNVHLKFCCPRRRKTDIHLHEDVNDRYHHNLLPMKRGTNFILRIMLSLSVLLQNLHHCFFLLILLISCYSRVFRGQGQNRRYMVPIFLNRHIKPISAN